MTKTVTIRRARRDDVETIVKMLADDALGGSRERLETPLPDSYFAAFERVERDVNLALVVAEGEGGAVIGCLQLCILPGLSSQGASRGLIEDVPFNDGREKRAKRHREPREGMSQRVDERPLSCRMASDGRASA